MILEITYYLCFLLWNYLKKRWNLLYKNGDYRGSLNDFPQSLGILEVLWPLDPILVINRLIHALILDSEHVTSLLPGFVSWSVRWVEFSPGGRETLILEINAVEVKLKNQRVDEMWVPSRECPIAQSAQWVAGRSLGREGGPECGLASPVNPGESMISPSLTFLIRTAGQMGPAS